MALQKLMNLVTGISSNVNFVDTVPLNTEGNDGDIIVLKSNGIYYKKVLGVWEAQTQAATGSFIWINDGLPEVKTILTPYRGMYMGISDPNGPSTIINYDSIANSTLSDNYFNTPVTYNGLNTYRVGTTTGVALEFIYKNYIKYLDLYFQCPDTATITVSNIIFHIIKSEDGVNWELVEDISINDVISTNHETYRQFTFTLSELVQTKYIGICSDNTFRYLYNSAYYNCDINELKIQTSDLSFGKNSDMYIDRLTGNQYQKINDIWENSFNFPVIPETIIGTSALPPSGAGKPNGSLYIVI